MPWHVVEGHSECGPGRFGVVKDDGGELVACHDSRQSADDQVAALYASEDDRGRSLVERLVNWDEGAHPRAPQGTSTGGQFAKGQGDKSPARKPAPKTAGRRPAAAKKGGDSDVLAYDPDNKTGPGYGMKGGDPRVRRLQEVLNGLGLTDAKGKKLAVDGKLGPLTTQAVKAAQKKLGVEQTGKVTPDFIRQLAAAKPASKRRSGLELGETRGLGVCVRSFDFELRDTPDSRAGRTLEGYVAVYDKPTRISDLKGDFEETIKPGAFTRSLKLRTPVMQFEHGRDPRVGAVPIGVFEEIREDKHGVFVRGPLFDNPVVEPVRQAIAGRAIRGMSFRFQVTEGGDRWYRNSRMDARDVIDSDMHEGGPVVFPAYDATSVSVRSLLAGLDPDEIRELVHELAGHLDRAVNLDDLIQEGLDPEETAAAVRAGRSPWTGDSTDLTGRPAQGAGGGESDNSAASGERSTPSDPRTRDRVLRAYGVLSNA